MGIDWEEILGTDESIDSAYEELVASAQEEYDYTYGEWNGEIVRIKNIWNGYYFSDQELQDLFDDKSIKIKTSINGKQQEVVGKLENLEYKGTSYVGFSPNWRK